MALNDIYELGQAERKKPQAIDPNSLGLKPVMKRRDWIMVAILIVVAGGLWTWVWAEYKKPIITEVPPISIDTE